MKKQVIVLASLVFVLFSCNSTKKSSDKKDEVVEKENNGTSKIYNTYIVKELNGNKELVVNPTMVFTSNSVSGNSGCNNYGGKVAITGTKIKFGDLMGTKMYCEKFMHIEREFLNTMSKADHFKIEDKQLFLYDNDGVLLLIGAIRVPKKSI